jgi:hypothetical protein
MKHRPTRAHGPLPNDLFVIRPIRPVSVQPFPPTRIRRLWWVLSGIVAVTVGLILVQPAGRTAPVFLFLFAAIVAWSYVWLRQPGTFVYASRDRVGVRTVMGSRFEVPSESVDVVRVGAWSSWGIHTGGVILEAGDGLRLLAHEATYDATDLRQLAERIGATFQDS